MHEIRLSLQSRLARLVAPHPSVTDPEHYSRVRLLNILLWIMILTSPLGIIIFHRHEYGDRWTFTIPLALFMPLVFFGVVYPLNRRGHVRLGLNLVAFAGTLTITIPFLFPMTESISDSLYYLIFPIVLATLLLPAWDTLAWIGFHILLILALPLLNPNLVFDDFITDPLLFYAVIAFLLWIISTYLRYHDTRQRSDLSEQKQHYQAVTQLLSDSANLITINPDGSSHFQWISTVQDLLGHTADELRAMNFEQLMNLIHPDDRLDTRRAIEQTMCGEKTDKEFRGYSTDGHLVWLRVIRQPVWDQDKGRVTGYYTLTQDITARKQAELIEQERRAFAEKLNQIARHLTSALNLNEVLAFIADAIEQIIPYDTLTIVLFDAHPARPVYYRDKINPAATGPFAQSVLTPDQTQFLFDQFNLTDPMLIPDVKVLPPSPSPPPGSEWIQSLINLALRVDGKPIGFIGLASKTLGYFPALPTTSDAISISQDIIFERLRDFAANATIAIQNARLYEQGQKLATIEERQRIAHDLHDSLSQTLFALNMIAGSLPALWDTDAPAVRQGLHDVSRLAQGAQSAMRTVLYELQPEVLTESDLGDLLATFIQSVMGKHTSLQVSFQSQGNRRLPGKVQIAFYRTAQEAFNNILNHAQASQVWVEWNAESRQVQLIIRDNGRGFDVTTDFSGHFGLQTMRERAVSIGANLDIASRPGEGTTIRLRCTVPS